MCCCLTTPSESYFILKIDSGTPTIYKESCYSEAMSREAQEKRNTNKLHKTDSIAKQNCYIYIFQDMLTCVFVLKLSPALNLVSD